MLKIGKFISIAVLLGALTACATDTAAEKTAAQKTTQSDPGKAAPCKAERSTGSIVKKCSGATAVAGK